MKRLIGILLAAGGIAALLLLATFGDSDTNFTFLQAITTNGADETASALLKIMYGEHGILHNLYLMIKEFIENNVDGQTWLEFAYYGAAVVGLPLFMIFAGLCKKFGRFFWGILAVACGVINVLVWKEVIPLNELSYMKFYFATITPYIGYWIAIGCAALITITAFLKEKRH